MTTQPKSYEHDRTIWEQCAGTYERQIVRGHPDVTAYESFEHSLIEKLVLHLTRDMSLQLHCYDFGCGSGRIHTLLAPLLMPANAFDGETALKDGGLVHVGGIDFSTSMVELAQRNLYDAGFGNLCPERLSFDTGSAFDVPPYTGMHLPLAVSVCNSIGVMQGEEGARSLFRTMQRFVKPNNGIALISCYSLEAVEGYALGNYESTMDVSGQPRWLEPDTYSSRDYTLLPKFYKRAHDPETTIIVDVYDREYKRVHENFVLHRNRELVDEVIRTGHVITSHDYHSRWYAPDQIIAWMRKYWGDNGTLWHIPALRLDRLRGEPAQLAIVDYSGAFEPLGHSWDLTPLNL